MIWADKVEFFLLKTKKKKGNKKKKKKKKMALLFKPPLWLSQGSWLPSQLSFSVTIWAILSSVLMVLVQDWWQ